MARRSTSARLAAAGALPAAGMLAAAGVLAACQAATPVPARRIECTPDTPQQLCDAVAWAAISAVNREAVGPVALVKASGQDCASWARENFDSLVYGDAVRCWAVDVVGERSRGWSVVYQEVDGGPLKVHRD